LNFIGRVVIPQRVRASVLAIALATAACGGKHAAVSGGSAPTDPEAAVRAFLNAVKTNSMAGMRELWGSERGPAVTYLGGVEVEQRLTVIRTYLDHERFEFAQPNEVDPANNAQRIVKVRLTRGTCHPVVPITTVRWGNGWLVKNIDLSSAGNPARPCPEHGPGNANQ
jgi:hypothetical protein